MADDWDEKTVVATDAGQASQVGSKNAQLLVVAGNNVGEMYALRGTMTMGRGKTCEIRLQGDGISREHSRLRVVADTAIIEDLKSTNGTFVNGEQVRSKALADGDKVQLGSSTILKYTYQDAIDENFQRQMFESASRDALTNIYNKRFFFERLQSEFAFAKRHGAMLALIMFDIDHFKPINDTHGHLAGDHVLAGLADVVMPTIRSEDVFARYGGEEFVVLSRSTDPPAASVVAERVRSHIDQHDFVFEGTKIPVTVSVGLATMPDDTIQSPEDLIARADKALYEAKRGGRNRVVVS